MMSFVTLDQAGAFEGLGRVELIDGEIFVMAPLYRPHARALWALTVAVEAALHAIEGLEGLTPISAELGENSLPEADLVIASRTEDDVVTAQTVRLVIEVAVSSLRHDLGPKLRLYARAGIAEYWVADVNGRRILRFHAPAGESYNERAEFAFGDRVSSATIPDLVVDTARLA